MSWGARYKIPLNPEPDTIFFAIKTEDHSSSYLYFGSKDESNKDEPNSQKLFLMSEFCEFPIFEYIPKDFSISTKNVTCNFNTILLKETSPVISDILKNDSSEKSFFINVIDEENVLRKFEELYQGKTVIFDEDEIPSSQQITKILKIQNCPNLLKPKSLKYNQDVYDNGRTIYNYTFSRTGSFNDNKIAVKLCIKWFIKYLRKNDELKIFTISTKKNKYKCNIFGIYSSNIIRQVLKKEPSKTNFEYDFDDESNDFQLICDLFNFKKVGITNKNMHLLKKIADDLKIECIIKQIDNFISSYKKITEKVEREKIIINSIDNLFDLLYNIKKHGIQKVKDSIMESKWIQDVDSIKEIAAFIIQVIRSSFVLQQEMSDLLIQLNEEANESNKLNELIPFIVNILMNFYFKDKKSTYFRSVSLHSLNDIENKENIYAYQFIFILYKKGIIPKEQIIEKLKNYDNQNKYINIYFLVELMELNPKIYNEITTEFRNKRCLFSSVIESYFPDKIDQYQKKIEEMEPDDELTKSLRKDDVEKLKYIIKTDYIDVSDAYVPYNIFDDFSEKVTLINYAAFCGSLQCFKYLLTNNGKIDKSTFFYAVYGNNFEIIKIVDSTTTKDKDEIKKKKFEKEFEKLNNEDKEVNPIQTLYINGKSVYCLNYDNDDTIISSAIILHRNELFDWLFEKLFISKNRLGNDLKEIAIISAISGNAHSLIEIIDKGFNINIDVILSAAKNGFYQLTKLLLSMIDQKEKLNTFQSVLFGNLSIFKLFFNEMDFTDRSKSINCAIEKNYKDIIDYFFDNIEKVNHSITNSFVLSSLIESLKTNELFDFLLEKYKKIKPTAFKINSLNKLLYNACNYSNLHATKIITDLILAKNSQHDFNDDFLASNSAEICRYFIDKKVNLNYEQLSLNPSKLISFDSDIFLLIFKEVSQSTKNKLMKNTISAIKNKNKKLIEFFLNAKKPNQSELIEAVYTHDIEIVDLILKYNKDPSFINHNGGEALIAASLNNDLDIVKRLLSLPGIDPTLYEFSGETSLSMAINNNNIQIVEEIVNFFGNDDNIQKNISFFYYSFNLVSKNMNNNNNNNYNIQNNNKNIYNVNFNYLKSIVKIFEITSINPNYCGKNTFLYEACLNNEIEVVERLLKLKNIDVNKYDTSDFNTPLMIAIENKNTKIAKLLIQYPKTKINLRNLYDDSALTIAVSKNLKDIVDLIINNDKFDPVESNFNFAFFNANPEISKQLEKYSFVDVNYTFEITCNDRINEKTALVHSVYINDVDKIDFIINHPSFDKDKSNIKEAIFESAKTNNINIFRKLIKFVNNDINICNQKGKTLLFVASKKLSGKIIDEILNNPNFDAKRSQICEAFIRSFSSENSHQYCYMNAPYIKRKKYENCFYCDNEEYMPNWEKKPKLENNQIWQSIEFVMNYYSLPLANTKIEIMNQLLNYDKENSHLIHLNELLPDGRSFFSSICSDYVDIDDVCKFLLDHGVDPNQKDKKGIFPLLTAIGLKSEKFVSTLLNNADIDFSQLGNKTTYLHVAAAYSNANIVKILLEKNVFDINSKDINGDTPLIIACKAKKVDVIEYLFKHENLDYLHCNNYGIDALNTVERISPSESENARKNKKVYENLIINKLLGKSTFGDYKSKELLNTNNVFTFKNKNDN